MIVAQDGSGDFKTLQAAIDSLPKNNQTPLTIYIKSGIYKEKLHIEVPFLTLKGENEATTKLTYDDYAEKAFASGQKYGTFRSYTLFIGTHDVHIENLTIENSSGEGSKVGQALAVYADGDRLCFKNCRLLGHQDTLFTGPLPPSPMIPGSFVGPREHAPRLNGRQYYENCYIEGEVDFIFGSATAFFYNCELYSIDCGKEINGYVTAPSTPEGQAYGYVFEQCKLTSNCPMHSVYLGRPWRNFAKSVFIHCELGAHIHEAGWHNWHKKEAETACYFGEYDNIGMGASLEKRASFSHYLTKDQLPYYSRQAVLCGTDQWMPWIETPSNG